MEKITMTTSWFTGFCKLCKFNVVVTQPDNDKFVFCDYWWYCSNKKCDMHIEGSHTGDMEIPDWVEIDYSKMMEQ
jgi:hypothetical protein